MNWLTIALPLVATLFVIVAMVSTSGSGSAVSFVMFIPVMMATYLASGIDYFLQNRNYKRALKTAQEYYNGDLLRIHDRLDALRQTEQQLRSENDPDINACLEAARKQDPGLGDRRPGDDDFMSVRLGIGEMPASITIEVPAVDPRPPEFADHFQKIDQWADDYSRVERVPFLVKLNQVGSVALIGPRVDTAALARSAVSQLATHHWLTEVNIAAVGKRDFLQDWEWLGTLPHAKSWMGKSHGDQGEEDPNAGILVGLEAELRRRQQIWETNQQAEGEKGKPILPWLVVIVDHFPAALSNPALMLLLRKGQALGAVGLFLVEEPQEAPGECGAIGAFDYLTNDNRLSYKETGAEGKKSQCKPDQVSAVDTAELAIRLAKIEWRLTEDTSQPPRKVTFLDTFGANSLEELDIEEWWDGTFRYGYLRAPIGKLSRDADLIFDLNDKDDSHGPHGLVGGMPGSGKSELLRTIVLAFALTHHPYDLNFALIDYKGGATFSDLTRLPHTVGVITDLESHASYAERVILSLSGEIKRRERILEDAKRTFGFEPAHIDEYRKLPVKRPLPRLVVIFDEFAQFKQRHPEESKALIEISRKGRSLGIHLILATQNLREAVDDVVRQNSNFLMALRVSEPGDSNQLIGIPDAAFLTKGRGYLHVRSNLLFQAAFAGAPYKGMLLPDDAIVRILPNKKRQVVYPLNWDTLIVPESLHHTTEAQVIIDLIERTAGKLGIEKPPAVWQDALPERLYTEDIESQVQDACWEGAGWKDSEALPAPILGLVDDPSNQVQWPFCFDPLEEGGGHLLIFGSPGSGKSMMLRTIVANLARNHAPNRVNLYIADLAGRPTLDLFRSLPHVGAVITHSDGERIDRLVRTLRDIARARSRLFARAHVEDLRSYNQKMPVGDERLPMIFVLIDDLGEFKRNYLDQAKDLGSLLNAGRSLGISFIITALSQNDLPSDAFNNIQSRITFNQAERSSYSSLVGYLSQSRLESEFGTEVKPGRGLLRGNPPLLFQAALPTRGANDDEQLRLLDTMIRQMNEAWCGQGHECAMPIRILEPVVGLDEIIGLNPRSTAGRANAQPGQSSDAVNVLLGQDYETLDPAGFGLGDDGNIFLVAASSPKMGKTTALLTWAFSMAKQYPSERVQFLTFDFHKHSLETLKGLPHILNYIGRRSGLEQGIRDLTTLVQQRREKLRCEDSLESKVMDPALVIFIDDYFTFLDDCSDDQKRQLWDNVLNSKELGIFVVFAADVSEVMNEYSDQFLKKVRTQGSGILLSPKEGIDIYRNARVPYSQLPTSFTPGRGWLVKRGQPRLMQIATCDTLQ